VLGLRSVEEEIYDNERLYVGCMSMCAQMTLGNQEKIYKQLKLWVPRPILILFLFCAKAPVLFYLNMRRNLNVLTTRFDMY